MSRAYTNALVKAHTTASRGILKVYEKALDTHREIILAYINTPHTHIYICTYVYTIVSFRTSTSAGIVRCLLSGMFTQLLAKLPRQSANYPLLGKEN